MTGSSEILVANPTVFVIDDDEDIRTSLTRSLKKRGYAVEVFSSAKQFLDAFDETFHGCIILDYGMPDMTGLELQKVLVTEGRALPIIFITGHGGVPESVQAMKAGAIDFLEKPFRSEVLIDRINMAFESLAKSSEDRKRIVQAQQLFGSLTARETEIVDFMVSNPSLTTSKDVARALDISPRTVDHHRARILEKMKIKSVVELVDLSLSVRQAQK